MKEKNKKCKTMESHFLNSLFNNQPVLYKIPNTASHQYNMLHSVLLLSLSYIELINKKKKEEKKNESPSERKSQDFQFY